MSNILRLKPGEWDLSDLLRNPNLDQINNALERINEKIITIIKSAHKLKNDKVVIKLKDLIPEFISNNSSYERLDKVSEDV